MDGKAKDYEYVAIRLNKENGKHWIDFRTMSGDPEYVKVKVDQDNRLIPAWAVNNPVVRIAYVKIEEV